MTPFESLGLGPNLLQALKEAGYEQPTPIQAQAIRPILEGRDLLGIAQTGTGKTAAFALPLLENLARKGVRTPPGQVRVLILTPTRELAAQIEASFKTYGRHTPLRTAVIFGGVGQGSQVKALERGLDVLIATPGRLMDLMQQRHARLGHVEVFVLDEADRMLDMGFIRDVRKITATLPAQRQTLLFSATMPDAIATLAQELLRDPVRVEVTPQSTTVERITQKLLFVDKSRKRDLLRHLLADGTITQALVFTRTKRGADRVAEDLAEHAISAGAIHGNKAQNHRERTLRSFRGGSTRVLVATDIAARGLDIPGVSHVFNYELPDEPESYVHRIGRTARAGRDGTAVAFCCSEELEQLREIEKLIGITLDTDDSHPFAVRLERLPVRGRGQAPSPRSQSGGHRPQGGHRHQSRHHRDESSSDSRSAGRSGSGAGRGPVAREERFGRAEGAGRGPQERHDGRPEHRDRPAAAGGAGARPRGSQSAPGDGRRHEGPDRGARRDSGPSRPRKTGERGGNGWDTAGPSGNKGFFGGVAKAFKKTFGS